MALDQTGKPYEWGGRGPDKFDCSGLITWVYKQAVGKEEILLKEELKQNNSPRLNERHKIMNLSQPQATSTVKLKSEITNDKTSDSGRTVAFVQGRRYVGVNKLKTAQTTTELE